MGGGRQQITLKPAVLRWARERVDLQPAELAKKIGVSWERVEQWEKIGKISLSQLDKLAHNTYTPLGFLYLSEPPKELDRLPIPDFRSRDSQLRHHPSINLLETVQITQRRQAWMREELLQKGADSISFVGSTSLKDQPNEVAKAMKNHLCLEKSWAVQKPTWESALRHLRDSIENARIMVIFNGVVENNTHRKLDREEFQGFALIDNYAPLIFINGADYQAAQMFTLSHELAHIFIGVAGVSKFEQLRQTENATEKFCDQVAAEFLVPSEELRTLNVSNTRECYSAVARHFKVSTIVAARRMLDLGLIDLNTFFNFYKNWKHREINKNKSGGNFWRTQKVRVGRLFGAAVGTAVGEGRLFYRDAYNLTGLREKTFDTFIEQIHE